LKTAIVCITKHGYHLGLRVKQRLLHGNGEVDLFAPARAFVDPGKPHYFKTLPIPYNRYFRGTAKLFLLWPWAS
jgi:hypothetical protein